MNWIDAIRKIWLDDGLRGFYRGSLATCLLYSCQSSINWTVYEKARRTLHRAVKNRNIQESGDATLTNTRQLPGLTKTHLIV